MFRPAQASVFAALALFASVPGANASVNSRARIIETPPARLPAVIIGGFMTNAYGTTDKCLVVMNPGGQDILVSVLGEPDGHTSTFVAVGQKAVLRSADLVALNDGQQLYSLHAEYDGKQWDRAKVSRLFLAYTARAGWVCAQNNQGMNTNPGTIKEIDDVAQQIFGSVIGTFNQYAPAPPASSPADSGAVSLKPILP